MHKSLSLIFYWCGIKVFGVSSFPVHGEYLPSLMHSPMLHLYVTTPLPSLSPTSKPICPACSHILSVTETLKSLSKDLSVSAPHYTMSSWLSLILSISTINSHRSSMLLSIFNFIGQYLTLLRTQFNLTKMEETVLFISFFQSHFYSMTLWSDKWPSYSNILPQISTSSFRISSWIIYSVFTVSLTFFHVEQELFLLLIKL